MKNFPGIDEDAACCRAVTSLQVVGEVGMAVQVKQMGGMTVQLSLREAGGITIQLSGMGGIVQLQMVGEIEFVAALHSLAHRIWPSAVLLTCACSFAHPQHYYAQSAP